MGSEDFISRICAESGEGIVFGALPFHSSIDEVALFHAMAEDVRAVSLSALRSRTFGSGLPSCIEFTPRPSADVFRRAVAEALASISSGRYEKVVLSRCLDLRFGTSLSLDAITAQLASNLSSGYLFSLRLPKRSHRAGLIGATPELLLSLRSRVLRSTPLAGSLPRSANASETEHRARQLLTSDKDLREHRYVVEDIAARLAPYCRNLDVPRSPSIYLTPTMIHLGTEIVATVKDDRTSSLFFALQLHPTPALCGVPRAAAEQAIVALESEPRGLYGGLVGWSDHRGDGEWAVTIRCAEVDGPRARLRAGVGIVDGSTPQLELAETEHKLQTMLNAFGLSSSGDVHRSPVERALCAIVGE